MQLFVTGATGTLGRPLMPLLVRAGHTVRALCRSDENRACLLGLGVTPVEADLFDPASLATAFAGCSAVLHLATRIPPVAAMKKPGIWHENDRLRREGMAAVAAAARETSGLDTIIYPSVTLVYADQGDRWIEAESAPVAAAGPLQSTLDAEAEVAAFAQSAPERRGIVLRLGTFYGPSSADSRQMLAMARKGLAMRLAAWDAYKSMIWIDDAAAAVAQALESAPSGVFDVVENEPLTQRDSVRALARAVEKRSLLALPRWLLRLVLPSEMRELAARSQRVSNERFCRATEWQPSVPDQRQGWALVRDAVSL